MNALVMPAPVGLKPLGQPLTGDVVDIEVPLQIVKDVFLVVQNSVVRLEIVLLQKLCRDDGRKVEERIAHSEDKVFCHGERIPRVGGEDE